MPPSELSASNGQDHGHERLSSPPRESPLISEQYRSEQERLHESGVYGTASIQYAEAVATLINFYEVTHLLDYGCGAQTNLPKAMAQLPADKKIRHKVTYQAYDPGVPRFSKPPLPADLVACIDVLEHIEPQFIDAVLDDLTRLSTAVIFATIDTGPALKVLSDGRNAHVLQRPIGWWFPKLDARFDLMTLQSTSLHSFMFIGSSKPLLTRADGTPITC